MERWFHKSFVPLCLTALVSAGCDNDQDTSLGGVSREDEHALSRGDPNIGCTSDSGHFILVPVQASDHDKDGRYSVAFLPVQIRGLGVMTRASWVNTIDVLSSPSGYTLRVIHSNAKFYLGREDQLENADQVSTALTASNSFDKGAIDGNPMFVATELAQSDIMSFYLDIGWTCGGNPPGAGRPQGYSFRLSDIGCGGFTQKLTLRYATDPNRVSLEQYGTPVLSRTEFTSTVQDGEAFVFDREALLIDGVLLTHSATSATVRLNTIQLGGFDVCQTGTYVFSAE